MERAQFTQHLKEKAAAYALTAVVALGSLALVGEGDGSTTEPTPVPSHSKEAYPHLPTETSTMSREEQCANMEKEAGGPVKGC